jgi:hypothetical protein
MKIKSIALAVVATVLIASSFAISAPAQAAEITADYAGAPAGWSVDRYAPASFGDVGTFQGRDHVLGITIDSSTDLNNRPAAYQFTFYNTQGESHPVSGGIGSTISSDLFVEASWGDAANGLVRTDLWGVSDILSYPIIGFTNYGGAARFRDWDTTIGDWINLSAPINYGDWNTLSFTLTATGWDYFVNGALVNSVSDASTTINSQINQAYNFQDPALVNVNGTQTVAYTAHWDNTSRTEVPEPISVSLFGAGLAGVAALRRRKKARKA